MEVYDILSYLGGYYKSNEFELDIPKIADVAEMSEEEVMSELNDLHNIGDIKLTDTSITLIKISQQTNKKFNDLWKPCETLLCKPGMKLKLDV